MNATVLSSKLNTTTLGHKITTYSTIDSTNIQAKAYCEEVETIDGHLFVAERQSNGKGTDGNVWESAQGNLYLSVVFEYKDAITTTFPLYPAVALAKVLNEIYHIEAHVKWPNDVLVGQQKIAGILCEGAYNNYMIMGIGINVNQEQFPLSVKDIATSVSLALGQHIALEDLAAHFLNTYDELWHGHEDITKQWLQYTKMTGKVIRSIHNGTDKEVTVLGITPEGFLNVKDAEGREESWMARRGLDISTNY